jgi:hypothetical protein
MPHGVSVRSVRRALFARAVALAASVLAGCAGASAPIPVTDPMAAPPARCRDGNGPIEILAADVAIAIDRSASTRTPTGIDIDRNGRVGEFRHSEHTDRGD